MDSSVLSIIIILIAILSFGLEKIPLPITAMLAAILMGISGIIPLSDVCSGFASSNLMMVAGMIVIGNSIFETGLASWLGLRLTKSFITRNERGFLFAIMIFSSALSAFLSNSAVVAVCIPIVGSIVLKANGRIVNKHIIMGVGMAAAMGGACTLVGSTAQLAAQQVLVSTPGCRPMEFFELGKVCAPLCIILAIYFSTIGYNLQKKYFTFPDVNVLALSSSPSQEPEEQTLENGGQFHYRMVISGLVLCFCVIGFISGLWDVSTIALTGAAIVIVTGCISFRTAMATMDWNTIILLGFVQGLAEGLDASGGGRLIADFILGVFGGENASPIVLLIVGILISTVLTNFMSNTAVLAMITPIFINIGFAVGIHPEVFIWGCVIGGSTALATPIGTPCVTQTLVAGYRFKDYVWVGLPITVILTLVTCLLCPVMYGFHPI